jgi:hypothetical protein
MEEEARPVGLRGTRHKAGAEKVKSPVSKITRDKHVNAEYGFVKDFHKLAEVAPNEVLGWAGWRKLSRPRRCLSRFAKRVNKVLAQKR